MKFKVTHTITVTHNIDINDKVVETMDKDDLHDHVQACAESDLKMIKAGMKVIDYADNLNCELDAGLNVREIG
jgi:hypothetical protein